MGGGDYDGIFDELPYTPDDPHRIRDGLVAWGGMPADNAIVLTDDEATLANVRAAVDAMGGSRWAGRHVRFFSSGHGDRVARPDGEGVERADLDGVDETIEPVDGVMCDNDLNDLSDGIDSGRTVVMPDLVLQRRLFQDRDLGPGPNRRGIRWSVGSTGAARLGTGPCSRREGGRGAPERGEMWRPAQEGSAVPEPRFRGRRVWCCIGSTSRLEGTAPIFSGDRASLLDESPTR